MAKLIYAKSKAGFDTAYADKTAISKSIAFLEDGWLWTHGKYFKIFPDADPLFVVDASGPDVTVRDGNGKALFSLNLGVLSVTGDDAITATTVAGAVSLEHDKPFTANQVIGPGANSNTTIVVPQITFTPYGHYASVVNRTATLNLVNTVNTDSDSSVKYIVGSPTSTTTNAEALSKTTKITFNSSTGVLSANGFSEGGTALSSKYAPLSHVDVVATDTVKGHVTLSDSITSTSGVSSGVAATPKAVNDVYTYAQSIIASGDAMIFKGTIGANGIITGPTEINGLTIPTLTAYSAGWTFKVASAQSITGIGSLEVGDIIIAINDRGASYNSADWTVIQVNIDGAVVASTTLTASQLIIGDGTNKIKALAAGTAGQYLTINTSGIPAWANKTYRAVSVNGTSVLSEASLLPLLLKSSTGITLTWNDTNKDLTIATALQNLSIQDNGALEGSYVPTGTTNNTINFGAGLKVSLASNVFTVDHSNSATGGAQTTNKVRSFAYDAYGHITGSTEVTTLPSPNPIIFSDNATTPVTASYTGANPLTVKFTPASGDIRITAATGTNSITYTLGLTHKYRGIMYKSSLGGTAASIFSETAGGTLTIAPGNSNVTMALSGTELQISSANTWRNVFAYKVNGTLEEVLSTTTIGTDDLQFGSEFLWDDTNKELKLGWAEVAVDGAITYAY